MDQNLRTLLHEQATNPDFAPVDLDAITRTGDRRVRRRRGVTVLGGLVALAVVAVVALWVARPGDVGTIDPAGPYAEARVSWSEGSVIHYGDTVVDVGRPVEAFVHTDAGFVVVSGLGVWSVDGDRVTRVGTTVRKPGGVRLVADHDDGLAAWVEERDGGTTLAVLDQHTGETTRIGAGVLQPAAVDGGTAYWITESGAMAGDLATGETRVVPAADRGTVLAAEDGVLVSNPGDPTGPFVSRPGQDDVPLVPDAGAGVAALAPDADWVAIIGENRRPEVFDTRTGDRVPIDVDAELGSAYGWLDADTVLVVAGGEQPSDTLEVLACAVPSGTCEPVTQIGTVADLNSDRLLPWGMPAYETVDAGTGD
ncbi:hypothetical protein [Nocardioides lianchengensis]|uniref:PQQ-like domain-containing protein n=1 Tax=Nocardioides lianchengensis TaxID=1045774 RepID=A0A1G6R4R3_9ACTN|nr:hypothetical protein [Nocardioides lianchengensis]NYG10373.1 hypothetical protein [Nocardioides lianchengensis]SDC99413.1 hypothetical protein SAMN05421872_105145 [Nocardioides lianchengensis]